MKRRLEDLAMFGGHPAFAAPDAVGRPNIGDTGRLFAMLGSAIDRRRLSNGGPLVREFERRVAEVAGVRHCVAMCNGTVALQVAIRAASLAGEVIVPALTFAATAHAVEWVGLTPVFCDVDPRTANLDPESVAAAVTPRTTGIVGVHLWGRPCAVGALDAVARRSGLTLLFDAAHAFGVTHQGRPIGGFGAAEVFSFHATKFVNAFEGGAAVTDDDGLADRMRTMRNFGLAAEDEVVSAGTNAKMSEAAAAMGLASLDRMDEFVARNRHNYACYQRGLAGLRGIRLIGYDDAERNNYQYVIIELDPRGTGLRRDALLAVLREENVIARRYFSPGCHRMAPYRSAAARPLPATERIAAGVLALPTGTAVGEQDIATVCAIIRVAAAHGREVTRGWAALRRGDGIPVAV